MINRDGQINLDDGCSIDVDGIKKHKWPRVALINETVGAFTLTLISGRSVRQHYESNFDKALTDSELLSTKQRIKVGAVINIVVILSGTAIIPIAINGVTESLKSFGRL